MRTQMTRQPTHPGDIIKFYYLEPLALKVTALAEQLGVSRKTFSTIINRRAGVTPDMALRLFKGDLLEQINPKDPLMLLSQAIPWEVLENEFSPLYLHQPQVLCIAKGKAHKKYEFGSKVCLGVTKISGIFVRLKVSPRIFTMEILLKIQLNKWCGC